MTSGSILPALGTEPVVTVVTVKIHCADTVLGFRDAVQLTVAGVGVGHGGTVGIDNLFCAALAPGKENDRGSSSRGTTFMQRKTGIKLSLLLIPIK